MNPTLIKTFEATTDSGRAVTVSVWQTYRIIAATAITPQNIANDRLRLYTAENQEVVGGTNKCDLWIPGTGEKILGAFDIEK
jgi:hypothetical protein